MHIKVNLLPLTWNLIVLQWLGLTVCVWIYMYMCMSFFFCIFSLWSTERKHAVKKYRGNIFIASQPGSSVSTQYCWLLVVATSSLTRYERTIQPHSYKSSLGWDGTRNISERCLCIICPQQKLVFCQLIKPFIGSSLLSLLTVECVREEVIGEITSLPCIYINLSFQLLNLS